VDFDQGVPFKPSAKRDAATLREEVLEHGLTADRALELADVLEREDRLVEALEILTQANRLRRDFAVERRLVRLQRAAFAQLDRSLPPPAWPPFVPDDAQGTAEGPLVVTPGELVPATYCSSTISCCTARRRPLG
jgi:hypothetical protein